MTNQYSTLLDKFNLSPLTIATARTMHPVAALSITALEKFNDYFSTTEVERRKDKKETDSKKADFDAAVDKGRDEVREQEAEEAHTAAVTLTAGSGALAGASQVTQARTVVEEWKTQCQECESGVQIIVPENQISDRQVYIVVHRYNETDAQYKTDAELDKYGAFFDKLKSEVTQNGTKVIGDVKEFLDTDEGLAAFKRADARLENAYGISLKSLDSSKFADADAVKAALSPQEAVNVETELGTNTPETALETVR